MQQLIEQLDRFILYEGEGGATLNMATVPLAKARVYAEKVFRAKMKKGVDEVIPDFDRNYPRVQKAVKAARGINRDKMPVVEPTDTRVFSERLKSGTIDLFKPYYKGKLKRIKSKQSPMPKGESKVFLTAGELDGDPNDDKLSASVGRMAASKMKPIQSQIWLEKVIDNIAKFGVPSSSSPVAKTTIIVSRDGQIIDGHHRWAQAALAKPSLGMSILRVPLDIDDLLDLARTYGSAIGRGFKA